LLLLINIFGLLAVRAADEGTKCATTPECGDEFLICEDEVCIHKRLFPLYGIEIAGTCVLTVLMALSVMSGIGGGGVIVPLLQSFYSLSVKQAVASSGFTILTGAITRYFVTLGERHPDKDATCIDYSITNVMLPAVLVGSAGGVIFSKIFPAIVISICLTCLLLFLTIKSFFKAKQIY
jgi:uncharacterized membrane protein YfcA